MKKKLFLMCLVGLLSVSSAYAACEGGTEVTNTVGTTFCKSNVGMNWWSAAAWCRANGMSLATMYEMCPSWDGNTGEKCPELTSIRDIWSATASGTENAFVVDGGYVVESSMRRNGLNPKYAFCK